LQGTAWHAHARRTISVTIVASCFQRRTFACPFVCPEWRGMPPARLISRSLHYRTGLTMRPMETAGNMASSSKKLCKLLVEWRSASSSQSLWWSSSRVSAHALLAISVAAGTSRRQLSLRSRRLGQLLPSQLQLQLQFRCNTRQQQHERLR